MATRAVTITRITTAGDREVHVAQWAGLTQATLDDGAPVEMPGSWQRSVQVQGTLGAGGSVKIEGSNDGTNYQVLHDPQGVALDITALSIKAIQDLPRYIRPRVTAGDGTTSLTVTMLMRREKA